MTNIDRAARAVWEASRGVGEPLSVIASDHIAAALADAGLLIPDLPEPDSDGRWWPEHDFVYSHVESHKFTVTRNIIIARGASSLVLTRTEALELASILTAAATEES